MRLEDFFGRPGVKRQGTFPDPLRAYHPQSGIDRWKVTWDGATYQVTARYEGAEMVLPLQDLLKRTLPPAVGVSAVHNAVLAYTDQNEFLEGLPLFFVRRHGSYSGEEGSGRRRRGWVVKFHNAYVVFADNFLARHFFEFSYFADDLKSEEIEELSWKYLLPIASGGGTFESKHRLFPTLSHLTTKSNLYLSHLYGLNDALYAVSNVAVQAERFLSDSAFGFGAVEDWDNGLALSGKINGREINRPLTEDELEFLRAYNLRFLSPLNYFPFPKTNILQEGSINGENDHLRSFVISIYAENYGFTFTQFLSHARVPNIFDRAVTAPPPARVATGQYRTEDVALVPAAPSPGQPVSRGGARSKGQDEFRHASTQPQINALNAISIPDKRRTIITAFGKAHELTITRNSEASYFGRSATIDDEIAIVCSVSRRHVDGSYWYTYNPDWYNFLRAKSDGFLILGCLDKSHAFAIPRDVFHNYLSTRKPLPDGRWMLHLDDNDAKDLMVPPNDRVLSLKEFRFNWQ